MKVEPVDILSDREAVLLAGELPQLRRLIFGATPGLDPDNSERLVRDVLQMAHGNPQLLYLADKQASTPERLKELIKTTDLVWGAATSDAPGAAEEGYLRALGA